MASSPLLFVDGARADRHRQGEKAGAKGGRTAFHSAPGVIFEYFLLYIVGTIPFVVGTFTITRILYHRYGENATGI